MQTKSSDQDTFNYFTMRNILGMSPGKLIGITFRKLDGSIRRMSCRLTRDAQAKEHLTVFDVRARGYRRVSLDSILAVRLNGMELKIK